MKTYKTSMHQFSLKKEKSDFIKVRISSSKNAFDVIRNFYNDDIEIYESFFILFLNKASNTIGYAKISQGGTAGTVVDPLIVAKYIADTLSSAIIVAHNHPSGNLKPSEEDVKVTKRIQEISTLLGSKLLDHLILTTDAYFSFADEGLL